jgi:hypothetical protein
VSDTTAASPASRAAALDAQLVHVTVGAFFLAALFPFVTPIRTAMDTQPYAMMLALIIAMASIAKPVRRELVLLFLPMLASLIVLGIAGFTFTGVRSVANYLSIAVIPLAIYLGLRWDRDLFRRLLEFAVWAWLAAGLLQVLIGPDVLAPLLPDVRTSASRGVTGLAPETSHYGTQCILMLLLVLMEFEGRKRTRLVLVLLAQIMLLAQSSFAALFLFGMFGLYILTHIDSPRRLGLAALLGLAVIAALVAIARLNLLGLRGSRLLELAGLFVKNPSYVFILDGSANKRLSNIVLSFYGFFDAGMVPQGFGTFAEYVLRVASRFPTILTRPAAMERIMSGYGAALFELGVIGLIIPGVISYLFWKRFRDEPRRLILYLTTFSLMLVTATPLANPLVGTIAGYLAFTHHSRTQKA